MTASMREFYVSKLSVCRSTNIYLLEHLLDNIWVSAFHSFITAISMFFSFVSKNKSQMKYLEISRKTQLMEFILVKLVVTPKGDLYHFFASFVFTFNLIVVYLITARCIFTQYILLNSLQPSVA